MKCEKCGKEIQVGEKYYTAIGVIQCEDCNTKSNGTVSMDFIFDKIKKEYELVENKDNPNRPLIVESNNKSNSK